MVAATASLNPPISPVPPSDRVEFGPCIGGLLTRLLKDEAPDSDRQILEDPRPDREFTAEEALKETAEPSSIATQSIRVAATPGRCYIHAIAGVD